MSRLAQVPNGDSVVVASRENHAGLVGIVVDATDALPVRMLLCGARGGTVPHAVLDGSMGPCSCKKCDLGKGDRAISI